MKHITKIIGVLGVAILLVSVFSVGVRPVRAAINSNNLGDLVILGALFGNGNDSTGILSSSGNGGIDLGNLIILDQLFNTGSTRSTGIFGGSSSGKSSLGNLIILNQLFNSNNNNGLFGQGGTNNLGRLFVLDRLFSGTGGSLFSSGTRTTSGTVTPRTPTPPTTSTSTTSTPGAQAAVHMVDISSTTYTPQTITINRGDTVQWMNRDAMNHTVTSDANVFDSGTMEPGRIFLRTFNESGEFPYHCRLHPNMTGRIIVR